MKRRIRCLLAVFCISLLVPVSQAGAEKPTAAVASEMEGEVGSMEIEVPVTTPSVGWRCVPKLIFYPDSTTGLDTQKPVSYSNCVSKDKQADYYEEAVLWSTSNDQVLSVTEHASGTVVIAAEAEGTAVLTARLGKCSASVTFEVSGTDFLTITGVEAKPYDEVTQEALPKDTLTVTQGEEFDIPCELEALLTSTYGVSSTITLNASMEYQDLIEWSSSDESVIDVKYFHSGGFKALKPGKAVITVKAGNATDSIMVTVKNNAKKDWCSPVESDEEKRNYAEKYGKTIHTEKELYQYVYDNLSAGNYELAVIYPEEYLSFDLMEELQNAISLYEEYIVIDERCDKNDEAGAWISQIFISGAREAVHYCAYQPESEQMVTTMTNKADKVLESIFRKSMTEKQKIRAIHDYLVKNCDYDRGAAISLTRNGKKYVNKNVSGSNCHTAYGALVEEKAVCEGYAHAFNLLARRAGIPSILASGAASGQPHAWNMVKVGGKYRYIDVTWDDPVPMYKFNPKKPFAVIVNKKVSTRYFLVTEKKLHKDHDFVHKNKVADYQKYYQYTTLK